MAPPRSSATSAKRGACPRAPPNPSPAPPTTAAADGSKLLLLRAALDGDLRLLKRLVRELDKGRGRPREAVEAAEKEGGAWALHFAAGNGRLPVCKYLVEELGVDVDSVHNEEAMTPLVCAILGGNRDTVSYLLDHGANPAKAEGEGFTPLHHAAGTGDDVVPVLVMPSDGGGAGMLPASTRPPAVVHVANMLPLASTTTCCITASPLPPKVVAVTTASTWGGGETTTSTRGCGGDDDGNIDQLSSKYIVTGLRRRRHRHGLRR